MTHLDTSFLVRALSAGTTEAARLQAWVREGEPLGISTPAWAEYLCGPMPQGVVDDVSSLLKEPRSFGTDEARLAAHLFNESGRRRGTLVDCMIAAIAIASDATLATSNPSDFRRLEPLGLRLASPT
jgi:predicted nucleic acid-binding protein